MPNNKLRSTKSSSYLMKCGQEKRNSNGQKIILLSIWKGQSSCFEFRRERNHTQTHTHKKEEERMEILNSDKTSICEKKIMRTIWQVNQVPIHLVDPRWMGGYNMELLVAKSNNYNIADTYVWYPSKNFYFCRHYVWLNKFNVTLWNTCDFCYMLVKKD